jgi:DNA polymerase I-like protein with 3'-5' exonuclease and polymerase domains
MKRLVLVDGNALLHRAYHATPPLTTSKGELVNAVYGFTSMILKEWFDLKPDFMAIAWDMKGPTFRHQAYTQYKATRGPSDDGLTTQYGRVKDVVEALNIPEFRLAGYEADDLIGTLACQAQETQKNLEVIILTGDRDIMQVIDKNIKVLMPKKTLQDVGLYGIDEFVERFGFSPKQLIDYKALAGDASDNIPGVPGIGQVTATKLVQEFGTIEKLYQPKNLKILPERTQKLLAEGSESAAMSKQLATIELQAPIKLDLAACRIHDFDRSKVVTILEELEFKTLVNRFKDVDSAVNGFQQENTEGEEAKMPHSQHTTDLDLEVTLVLEKMTKTGVLVDCDYLEKLGIDLKDRLQKLEKEIYAAIGHEFNINSPKQLADILFDELQLPVVRKTKTGRSTDEETLQELKVVHPVVLHLLSYRQLFKLISTYIDPLPTYVGEDGRIHSTFNVEGAATGRLSSTNPNLQNIPIRGELGGEIRKAFVAAKGKVLLGADYSQIELRIMAHLSDDPGLEKAFSEGIDIHALTASRIFKIPVEEVNKEQRSVGKTMNFATLYGQGPRALSKQLGVEYKIAQAYILEYFQQFPKVKEWMAKVLTGGYANGYVETIWGRKRHIPELQSGNHMLKAFGERAAINHPVQGTSADMIKKAMVEIDKILKKKDCCELILQVHDELLFECQPECVEEMAKMIKEKMENALTLSVPVQADLKTGNNWGEMSQIKM